MVTSFSRNNARSWIMSMAVAGEGLLVNESPIRDPPRIYLWGANCLCANALKSLFPTVYTTMLNKIIAVKRQYNIKCMTPYALLLHIDIITKLSMQMSFKHNTDHTITDTNYYYANYDDVTDFTLHTPYANIQFLRCLYYWNRNRKTTARMYYKEAIAMWDGNGFNDQTFRDDGDGEYELYKYALYKIVQNKTGFPPITPPCALAAMNQDNTGAVYTHYTAQNITDYKAGNTVSRVSSTNTEVTPLCLMAGFSSTVI